MLRFFRLVVLGGIVVINWVLIAMFLSLFKDSPNFAGIGAIVVEGGLVAVALSPWGERYFRFTNRLRRPLPQEGDVLYPALERLAARCGLNRMPEVFIQHNAHPNALAVGTGTVAVTTGLLQQAPAEEIEAVLAHEVGHLVNGDTKIRLVAYVTNAAGNVALWALTGIILVMSVVGFGGGMMGGDRSMSGFGWFMLLLAWSLKASIWILTKLLQLSYLAVGRREEYAADEYAARHGYRDGLIAFLSRPGDVKPERVMAALHATHPAPEARIERLMRL